MRCFEIVLVAGATGTGKSLNNNMRCFEIDENNGGVRKGSS